MMHIYKKIKKSDGGFRIGRKGHEGTRRNTKRKRHENYKLQITNYKQIPNPKLQITTSSFETEYR
jgi:hypothetical protein